jgi:hypothetical protein
VRIEPVIAINGSDTVGPTRIRLHTASSGKLPAVIATTSGDVTTYAIFESVAALHSVLADQSAMATIHDAILHDAPQRHVAIASTDIAEAGLGIPVVAGGRFVGITAADIPEQESTGPQDPPDNSTPGPIKVLRARLSDRWGDRKK